ncbi:DUF4126 family protein [Mucilaginibacter sp. SMC90]|uniref:DUF4126 family protein n=1 Tax=Mucilaginibacter sp. SMC90 TaxID=2929803 RepID=UPI001FB2A338|nr:DUF4126 family protein [Mucilaginibacter sp. SMC90]UOE46478.1 DUF4126 family protein [Mucilaginibacter sp. SMC90]
MELKPLNPVWQVIGLGTLAGMRTLSAPVIATHMLSNNPSKKLQKSPLRFMQSTTVAAVLNVLSVTELIADKLPSTPNRIEPGGVAGRCLSGALAGASIYKAVGGKSLTGALIGGATAIAATYGSYYLRKNIVKANHIADPLIGAAEDALVIGAGFGLTKLV